MLDQPLFYDFFQQLLARRNNRKTFVESYLCPVPGERLLDLGCGSGHILGYLPSLDYWGLDTSQPYIDFARKKWAGRGKFILADLCASNWPVEGPFDRIMATGLLHHLNDREAVEVLRKAHKLLRPGAKFITIDGCYEKNQPVLARFLLSMDRGEHVRDRSEYEALARSVFGNVEGRLETGLLRLPYTHLVMEMSR